jgi:methyl-accepting chemotaxis protein
MFNMISRSVSRKLALILFCVIIILSLCNAALTYKSLRDQHYSSIYSIHETNELTIQLIHASIKGAIEAEKSGADLKKDVNVSTLSSILNSMTKKEIVENAVILYPTVETIEGKESLRVVNTNSTLAEVLPPMSTYEFSDVFKKGLEELKQSPLVLTDTYTDDNGTFVTSLSKIVDPEGKVIAIFGLDFKYSDIQDLLKKELIESFIIAFVLSTLFSLFIWFIITKQLAPLKELLTATNRAAKGDFSFQLKVTKSDEFSRLTDNFNTMLVNVSGLLKDISVSTGEVVASSQEMGDGANQSLASAQSIAESIQEIAASSEVQSQSTDEAKKAINEMAIGVQRIAESAGEVSDHVMDVSHETVANHQLMTKMVEQMTHIQDTVQVSVDKLQHLLARSSDIKGIIDIIGDIANQTNLLSLNASIEAARAGENGRGFAVVAGEIRKLAEQSRTSSESIAELIRGINQDTEDIATSMKFGSQEAASGTEIVKEVQTGFDRIANLVQNITAQVQEVSAATEQLSAGSEEIAATMEELSRGSELSSGNAQEIAASIEQQLSMMEAMNSLAQGLKKTSDQVNVGVKKFTI